MNALMQRLFFEVTHSGRLDGSALGVVSCGFVSSQLKQVHLFFSISNGRIAQACFQAVGSPYLIAGLEWLCREAEGALIASMPLINYSQLIDILEIADKDYPLAVLMESIYNELIIKSKFLEKNHA